MLPTAAAVVIAVVGAAVFVVADRETNTTSDRDCPVRVVGGNEPFALGSPMPDFALPSLDGKCFDSTTYTGRPLVVNFWASWCSPCRTEFRLLAQARERYGSDGVEIIGVLSQDITSDAQNFAEQRDVKWPLVDDDDELVGRAFGVRSIPETFFVASDGTVLAHIFGFTTARELNAEIERLLPR